MITTQKYINLASLLLVVLLMKAQVLSGNQADRQTYVVRYKHGDSLIPVTVVLDYKRQTEYVINMNSRSPAKSMTLYDFKEKVIAYKDLKNGECFIGRLIHETIQQEDAVLKRLKNPVESQPLILTLEPDRPSLTPTEVRNLAGHKAAVFCRRMNTWTLMPEKENRRVRRDALRHLDRLSSNSEDHSKSNPSAPQRSDVFISEQDNKFRNASNREDSSFSSNGSFSISHRRIGHSEVTSSQQQTSIADANIQHQDLNNVYPFILPRQKSFVDDIERRRSSRHDDVIQQFGLAQERSGVKAFPSFFQSQTSSSDNGTSPIPSSKHAFFPLQANRPVIIPSISFPSSSPKSKLSENHGASEIGSHSPEIFKSLHNYPPFHQLPPEAFVLPLTRPSTVTTAQPFTFNNLLGYEIIHPESQSTHDDNNNTVHLTGPDGSLKPSADNVKSVLTARSDHSAHPSSMNILDNPEASSSTAGIPSRHENEVSTPPDRDLKHSSEKEGIYIDAYTRQGLLALPDKSSNQTVRTYTEANVSSINRFDTSDSPIQVPRWYPEITKQISIPLEIEVLHHQEEYAHGVTNRTEEVHSIRGHEIEDLSSLPNANTIIPIPIEGHSNGVRSEKDLKLLPQVSAIKDDGYSKDGVDRALGRAGESVDRRSELSEFRGDTYRGRNVSLDKIFPQKQAQVPLLTNDTEAVDSVSSVRQDFVNQIPHQAPPYKVVGAEERQVPKRQHQFSESSLAVHDVKIDEGVPSYRKRFPAVSQLFTPDETVAEVGRLPDRHTKQSSPKRRRRPSALRNKTHGIQPRGYESKSAWRKHNLASRNLINQQQTRFSDQGITFHQRGYGKPGVPGIPYDYHRKRLGILPPGVSVHPRHPQAPYADLAVETVDKTIPVNPMLHARPRRVHLRHHRRHQRKRNRIQSSLDLGLPAGTNCCGDDGQNCCPSSSSSSSNRRRGRHFPNPGSHQGEGPRPNMVLHPQTDKNGVPSRKKVEEAPQDRCMKEKMCRTVYQSTNKVLVCRNVDVEGC